MHLHLTAAEAYQLSTEFKELLDRSANEQVYQEFLEKNTQLIPREFIQNHGLHFDLILRKFPLSSDYRTDFFYLAKSSAEWNCVLVELEKPSSRYFKDKSNDLHPEFANAVSQIKRWRVWLSTEANRQHFIHSAIGPLRPAHMSRLPCHFKYVLVHGRRSEFEGNDLRRQLIAEEEREDFKVLSYDSLVEGLQSKSAAYVGVKKNEFFDILSQKYLTDTLFAVLDPTYLRVSQALKDDIEANRKGWFHGAIGGGKALDRALPNLTVASYLDQPNSGAPPQLPGL